MARAGRRREKSSEVRAALRDTSVPAWSRLTRACRIVGRGLFDRPEWLSSRTESLRDIRFRRQRAERTTIAEIFHRRLHALHTIGRSSALGAGVFAVAVSVSIAVGVVFADAKVPEQVSRLGGTLVTIAEVIGGAAGILFAVIVFGIQYHGEKLDKAAFLVRYLRRREGLIPIAAFTLGVVAANVVVSLVCSLALPYAAVPMAILDVLLVLVVLWLVLWLLYRMTASVSDDFVTLLTPSLTWEYDRALDEDIHHARQMAVFEEALGAASMKYSTVAGLSTLDPVAPVRLNLRGRGSVADINLTALEALGDYARSACPDHDTTLCVGPGDSVDDTVALLLSSRRDEQGYKIQETVPPDVDIVRELERRLQPVFHLGAVTKHDVVEVLDRFQAMLVGYARSASEEELDRWLEVQGKLMERGLERADSVPPSFSIHRERLPDFLGGFRPLEMASNAVASGDREKVSVLLTFACRLMAVAVRREQRGLYHSAGEIIETIYHRSIAGEKLADYVGARIDSMLNSFSAQFEYAHSSWRLDPSKLAAQMPVLIVDLAWRLKLMKTALEAGRTSDAMNFQHRLFQWDRHWEQRLADPHEEASVPPELREASDLMSYATLITAAWCLHLAEGRNEHTDTTKAVFQRCASDLGSRHHLLRLWEAVRSKKPTGRTSDDPFGVIRWTDPPLGRTGVTTAYHVSDAWIERGFMALMLARPSSHKYEVPDALHAFPPFRPKSPDEIRTVADSILTDDTVRKVLLDIPDEKRDEAVDAVVTIFAKRLRLFKLYRLDTVVSAPLRDEHRTRLHAQIAKGLGEKRGLIDILEKLGGLQSNAHSWFWPRIQYEEWPQKDSVVDCCEHPMDFAPFIVRNIQEFENTRITHAAELIATHTTTVVRLADLADAVRGAITQLGRTTRNPILVFVPHERRIIEAILGHDGWQLPKRRELGDNHIGDWEACHMFRFPYCDPSSVLIVDALAFYGEVEESAVARLDLEIQHPKKQEHDGWLKRAQAETDPNKIPETDKVMVLAVARFSSGVGLRDPNAALRVALDLSKIGYALLEGEGVYHRPDCDFLQDKTGVTHSLATQLPTERTNRKPCEHCRPDDWEEQAEHDAQDAIAME